ncbi:hypothetical protein BCV69DRAFT_133659 [Microstroma glucosiphilum]|uniref:Transmembrane protein n=1 Tax=Pseudomicrostroma glucosiphilum TaxID=1684307 RepID=A0A316UAD9_9BASI|nr:hypothetical protein BCV69DRAFT_133659 [Pseudomicrostroma glucosiphilum]PWN22129.1 hypothetical protein BCV69DRAFT_133659 [Pseudomicrostroma glucosiphilum]
MRLKWSLFILGLLGQGAIASPVPMYEEALQRRDPFNAYTSRAKQSRNKEEVSRRGTHGTTSRGEMPYLPQSLLSRRDGETTNDEALDGYERSLWSQFGKVSANERARSSTQAYRRSLEDEYEDERSSIDDVAAFGERSLPEGSEVNDSTLPGPSRFASPQGQSQSTSLEKRVDFWQPPASQRTKQLRAGGLFLGLGTLAGLMTWAILRRKHRQAEKKKKEEAAAAAAKAHPPTSTTPPPTSESGTTPSVGKPVKPGHHR